MHKKWDWNLIYPWVVTSHLAARCGKSVSLIRNPRFVEIWFLSLCVAKPRVCNCAHWPVCVDTHALSPLFNIPLEISRVGL